MKKYEDYHKLEQRFDTLLTGVLTMICLQLVVILVWVIWTPDTSVWGFFVGVAAIIGLITVAIYFNKRVHDDV